MVLSESDRERRGSELPLAHKGFLSAGNAEGWGEHWFVTAEQVVPPLCINTSKLPFTSVQSQLWLQISGCQACVFFFWAEIPDSKGRRPLVKKLTSRSLRKCIWVMCHMIYVGLVMYCTSRLCFGLLLYGCNSKQNKQWCWCWWSSGIYHLKVTPKPHLKRFKITGVLFCSLTLYVVNTKKIFPTLCVIIRGHIWACQWRFEIAFSSNLDCVEWGIISTMLIL